MMEKNKHAHRNFLDLNVTSSDFLFCPVISWTPNNIRKTEKAADLNFVFAIFAFIKIVVFFGLSHSNWTYWLIN